MPKKDSPYLAHYGQGSGEAAPGGAGLTDWALPWSDIMMTLCVLFVVLFVYASNHKDVTILFRPPDEAAARAPASLGADSLLDRAVERRMLMDAVTRPGEMDGREVLFRSEESGVTVVREADGSVRITLRGGVFFDAGATALKPRSEAYLKELAEILRVHEGVIHVVGYSDEGEEGGADGFELSSRRAMDVTRHFLSAHRLDPRRFIVSGRGAFRPEVPSSVADSAERNRRVEILLLNGQ